MAAGVLERPVDRTAAARPAPRSSAAACIDGRQARVARTDVHGTIWTCLINRGNALESAYLAAVVDAIGDRERVLILGRDPEALALERAYVAIYRRPDRLVDVEPAGPVGERELVERVRELIG